MQLSLDLNIDSTANCSKCGLYRDVHTPKMKYYGEGAKRILVIGEAPGKQDDQLGRQWQGEAGELLHTAFEYAGVHLFDDCYTINAVNCQPTKNNTCRKPTPKEIQYCRGYVQKVIGMTKPTVIILVGGVAIESIIGDVWKKDIGSVTRWAGRHIPNYDKGAWLCPIMHPSYIMRNNSEGIYRGWLRSIQSAIAQANIPLPPQIDIDNSITIINSADNAYHAYTRAKETKLIAFDFETTGIKPYAKGHSIRYVSIAVARDEAYVFGLTESNKELLINILADPNIKKVGHNIKFETNWAKIILGVDIKGWAADTMLQAHILDSRGHTKSLKYQAYINYGISPYDIEVEEYLTSPNSNSLNALAGELNADTEYALLWYCGIDALITYHLYADKFQSTDAYQLLHDGSLAFAIAEQNGIQLDVEYCKRTALSELTQYILGLEEQFKTTKLGKVWRRVYKDDYNIYSSPQLSYVLYNILNITPPKFTPTKRGAVDKVTLAKLDLPELNILLDISKTDTIRDVLKGFLREQTDGVLHPVFNLHITKTYRSSSSNPNFQNIPKHDKRAMQASRSALYPRKGHQILEVDYSGMEVRMACCYTKDEQLIYDTLHGDMHLDMAKKIFLLEDINKKHLGEALLRFSAKSGFVFPEFYGDYYGNCAPNILRTAQPAVLRDGTPIYQHLANKGLLKLDKSGSIKDDNAFYEHIKNIEDAFWNERYKQYTQWKEDTWQKYLLDGYVPMFLGFNYRLVERRNNVLNAPMQGTAFHLLLWSFIELSRQLQSMGLETRLIGQIHDSIVLDVCPGELSFVKKLIRRVMCHETQRQFDWVIVPMNIEAEICDVDEPWSHKKEIGI